MGDRILEVDAFIKNVPKWKTEFLTLRKILLACGLEEGLKWGKPCYMWEGKNIVLMHGFKEYCALLFMKGALLRDDLGILVQQTQQVQAARQIRFTAVSEIAFMEEDLKAYVEQAVEVERAGLDVPARKNEDFPIPLELQEKMQQMPALEIAFQALTPGRQHGYILYFSQAKQAGTRKERIERYIPRILEGKGLKDR